MGEPAPLPVIEAADEAPLDDFADIVRHQQGMVFSIALHFLRDRQSAEEIAQDVFLHLHRHLDSLKSPEHVVFWLRKVTTHRCIDFARRRKWSQVSLDEGFVYSQMSFAQVDHDFAWACDRYHRADRHDDHHH